MVEVAAGVLDVSKGFQIPFTSKETLERIILRAGIRDAGVYQRWDRNFLGLVFGYFR
jgi:hypothetical protein